VSSLKRFLIRIPNAMPTRSISARSSTIFTRASSRQQALQAIADLARVGVIEDASLTPAVWQAAGVLKANLRRVSLADCFAVELAERLKCAILRADHHEFDVLAAQSAYQVRFIR
jgi:predicted nucleic acid-binding protein